MVLDGLDVIRRDVFTTKVGMQKSYSLYGEPARMERLLKVWKEKWDTSKKKDRIHYIEIDMAELSESEEVPNSREEAELRNWKLWYALLDKLKEAEPLESMEFREEEGDTEDAEDDFEDYKNELERAYAFFVKTSPEEISKLEEQGGHKGKIKNVFRYLKACKIQFILVLKHFECCKTLFPKEIETNFFSMLSAFTAKMEEGKFIVTMLLCSSEEVGELHHHHDGGLSPFMSCFPYGDMSAPGMLNKYEEEAFEEYLNSLQAAENN